ncbi:MAG: type II secretion system protein N [Gammaproteobacteria bacterium]
MFSLTDIEDKLLRPSTAQIFFVMMAVLLSYELLSGAVRYYRINVELKEFYLHSTQPKSTGKKQSLIEKTLNIPIFGEYIPKALVDLDVKPSGLDLILVGIVFSPDSKKSMAIISVPGNQSQTFSTGDLIPGGAKIKQITPDGVVLKREGELESLSLPKNELNFEPLPKPLMQKQDSE